jgi:hypothetical protein
VVVLGVGRVVKNTVVCIIILKQEYGKSMLKIHMGHVVKKNRALFKKNTVRVGIVRIVESDGS